MKEFILRYQRQITLEGFGIESQNRLLNAKVLVIGAGGLGCPALQYLAAAGLGKIGIVDSDTIDYSNLNRQVLFGQNDIGKYKVVVAAEKILALNDRVNITTYQQRCDQAFSIEEFPKYDMIVDATDNFGSRYLINDACVLLNKPLVFGAVSRYEGQIAVFNTEQMGVSVNYRDLFPEPPKNDEVMNCAQGGVLGVLPGIIGVMQATEVIKLISGVGETLANQLLTYNALTNIFFKIQLIKNPEAVKTMPTTVDSFKQTNYECPCN
jgi:sulfur-carrier protein adenylyltransferase/sulfurtransferase